MEEDEKKITLKCKFCGCSYELDENNIDKKCDWIECVFCGNVAKNPFKK